MFQCLGLGTVEEGGCGEDWWHPECLMGLPRQQHHVQPKSKPEQNGSLETVKEETEPGKGVAAAATNGTGAHEQELETTDEEPPLPTGFPGEDDFDHFICYKCVNVYPWIKQYAGTPGFLPALPATPSAPATNGHAIVKTEDATVALNSKKRKAEDDGEGGQDVKKSRASPAENEIANGEVGLAPESNGLAAATTNGDTEPRINGTAADAPAVPRHENLPPAPSGDVSLFLTEDFRNHLCRCAECFLRLAKHPQLLEEEDAYEPPVSESDSGENASATGRSVNSGSILERGEAALSSMDRVRAIEGVMAYNHVRDKVKDFLKPFAESGQAVGAEDIKAYFAKLRGDEQAGNGAENANGDHGVEGDQRRMQGGY